MPVMNFDLEDGLPKVSFTLMPDDANRFMAFMEECNGYMKQRDTAWKELRQIREAIKANPEESTFDEVVKVVSQRDGLLEALKGVIEYVDRPPLRSCSCHINPPCSDCVDWSHLREVLDYADKIIEKAEAT